MQIFLLLNAVDFRFNETFLLKGLLLLFNQVNEYIRSYFGESGNAEKFAKEFLEWNRRNRKQRSPVSLFSSESFIFGVFFAKDGRNDTLFPFQFQSINFELFFTAKHHSNH